LFDFLILKSNTEFPEQASNSQYDEILFGSERKKGEKTSFLATLSFY